MHTGLLRAVISGDDTVRLKRDTLGRIGIGMAITANAPTGIRIASIAASGSPSLTSYYKVEIADTTKAKRASSVSPSSPRSFPGPAAVQPGSPSGGRGALRPGADTVPLSRPLSGTRSHHSPRHARDDPPMSRSWACRTTRPRYRHLAPWVTWAPSRPSSARVHPLGRQRSRAGPAGPYRWTSRDWSASGRGRPASLSWFFSPSRREAASFTRPIFGSTRSASGAPQVRITYYQQFPFERP